MITAELNPGSFRPVDLIQWTASGKVQVRHRREIGPFSVLCLYCAVPVMAIVHSGGRTALAETLARLPREVTGEPAPVVSP
jgi:hypothetical protein